MPAPMKNLMSQKFGAWIVVGGPLRRRSPSGVIRTIWICECECGTRKQVRALDLLAGDSKSCGCKAKELNRAAHIIHGYHGSSIYNAWRSMLARCENPNNRHYKHYGGRGISICKEWHKFENFLADMGPKPEPRLTLERIEVNGNYEPGNCKWADWFEQRHNRRDS